MEHFRQEKMYHIGRRIILRDVPNSIMENYLHDLRTASGYTQEELAALAGTTHSTIQRLESGKRELSMKWAKVLAPYLNCHPTDLFYKTTDLQERLTPIVGYVGAGAEIYPIDDHPKGFGFDTVESPPGDNRKFVAVIVEGESMYPLYQSGDVLFYTRDGFSELDSCWGKACVVQITDGPMLVKTLQRGSETNMFNLISFNAPPKENIALDWAARVAWVKPK